MADHTYGQHDSVSETLHGPPDKDDRVPSYHTTVTELSSSTTKRSPFRRRQQPRTGRRRGSSSIKFWTWEIISLFLTIGLIVAVATILSHFDGRPLPDWPFGINLNTLIALLSTILRTLMLVAVAEALGQLKWSWFSQPASSSAAAVTPRPLHDFHVFDRASRGILGSMRLLGTVKHRNILATLGALVTILSLAIGPFTQQALKNVDCQRAVSSQNSSVSVAHFMGVPDSFQGSFSRGPGWYALPNDMKGAMINGLINPTGNDSTMAATCQTGNCTFAADGSHDNITYSSIGMCSKCIDTTPLAFLNQTLSAAENQSVYWQLPNGMQIELVIMNPILNISTDDDMSWAAAQFTDDYLAVASQALANVTVFSFTRSPCSNDTGTVSCPRNITNTFRDNVKQGAWDLVASSCALYPCMKNYHGDVEDGVFTETVVSTVPAIYNWPDATSVQKYFPLDWTEIPVANWTALKDPCVIDDVEYSGQKNNFSDVPRTATRNFTNVHSNSSLDGGYYHAPEECVYTLSAQYVMGMYDWMTQTLFAGSCEWPDDTSLIELAEPDCSNQFWLSPLWNERNASFASVSSAMDAFAAAVTNKFRTDGSRNWYGSVTGDNEDDSSSSSSSSNSTNAAAQQDLALGIVYKTTVCVAVNWEWLLMPIILAALSTVLLVAMIVQSARGGGGDDDQRQQVWKSSVLPLLFYGPGRRSADDEPGGGAAAADLSELSAASKRTAMAFRNGPGGAGFVEGEEKGEEFNNHVRDAEVDSLMELELYQR